jgi:hypothetical protein
MARRNITPSDLFRTMFSIPPEIDDFEAIILVYREFIELGIKNEMAGR